MQSSKRLAGRAGTIVLVAQVAVSGVASAQIDYRNLDDDRPTLIEDAYPVERYAFEFLAPWRYSRDRDGSVHAFVPELEYGLLKNLQVGFKLPLATTLTSSGREWGISGFRLFGLYNLNTESRLLPALSVRADATFPVGELAGRGTQLSIKGIATRSWGRNRVHVNGAYTIGQQGQLAAAEAAHKWWAGVALDHTLFRQSTLLVGELYALRPIAGAPLEVNTSLGLRYQLTPMAVFDAGLTRRLRRAGPDYEITLGFSRAFAIPGLLPARH